MSKKDKVKSQPPTVITLTLTDGDGIEHSGILLIQRGDLAHVRQFTYLGVSDITANIKEAYIALAAIEAEPPVIPEAPKDTPNPETKTKAKAASEPVVEEEPTIDIPLKKGTKAVKISHLKIVGGETDAAAYRQAVLIAGKLIDGKLWDGASPIRIDDVYAVQRKLKHLSDREMSLFALEDFVQVGGVTDVPEPIQDIESDAVEMEDDGMETELLLEGNPSYHSTTFSANGHSSDSTDRE